jgi:hypothetical protein
MSEDVHMYTQESDDESSSCAARLDRFSKILVCCRIKKKSRARASRPWSLCGREILGSVGRTPALQKPAKTSVKLLRALTWKMTATRGQTTSMALR